MYTTTEVADALKVQPATVRRYTKLVEHPLKMQRKGRREMVIREDDLLEFVRVHGMLMELPEPSER